MIFLFISDRKFLKSDNSGTVSVTFPNHSLWSVTVKPLELNSQLINFVHISEKLLRGESRIPKCPKQALSNSKIIYIQPL